MHDSRDIRQQRRERRAILSGVITAVIFVGVLLVLRLQTPGAAPALAGQILMIIVAVALVVGAILFYRAWTRQNPPPVRPPPRGIDLEGAPHDSSGDVPPGKPDRPAEGEPRHPE